MACQSLRKERMQRTKWTLLANLHLLVLLLGEIVTIVSSMTVGENPVSFGKQGYGLRRLPYKSLPVGKQGMQQRRLKAPGNEIIPAVGSNDISEEPTCEELRAMWRYYKRQSRAEANEIPQFGKNPFFGMLPQGGHHPPFTPVVSSFASLKGRGKNRLRPQNPLYGRPMYKPSKGRGAGRNRNKPFERVRELMGKTPPASNGNGQGEGKERATSPPEAIVLLSPPPQPTKESSFQKLKDMYRKERMKDRAPTTTAVDNREYGKIVLSPPGGQDGRRVNKPLELMTAFEKIRFGHADDLLDEGIKPNLDVMKRRTLPPTVLKSQLPQWKQQFQKRRFLSNSVLLLTPPPQSSQPTSTSSRYFGERDENINNNNLIVQTNDKQQLGSFYEFQNVPSQPIDDNPASFPNANSLDSNDPSNVESTKYNNPAGQMVEAPTCVEVEHNPCNQTTDCSCIGFALYRCYLNQCQILPLAFSVQEEPPAVEESWPPESERQPPQPEIWHSEPLPSEKLGIWEEPVEAERLNTFETSSKNEGKPSRLTERTYLVLDGQQKSMYA